MLSELGFYILFIFKLFLIGVLSLIINYLYKDKLQDSETLKLYSMMSLVMVALVAISDHYSSQTQGLMVPFVILSIFGVILVFLSNQKISNKSFMQLFLIVAVSISIGLGYYISSISLIVVFFIINYFLEGVFDFFISEEKDMISENKDTHIDIEDIDIDIIDEE